MIDLVELDRLRQTYQRLSEDVGQGDIEGWSLDSLTEAEAAANAAGAEWLRAVHRAWPEIRERL